MPNKNPIKLGLATFFLINIHFQPIFIRKFGSPKSKGIIWFVTLYQISHTNQSLIRLTIYDENETELLI